MDDLQKTDISGPSYVSPPAELATHLSHPDHTDSLPVPLVEDRRRPRFHRFRKGKDPGLDGEIRPDHPVGLVLDPCQFLLVDPGEVGEIEPEPFGVHQGAGLFDMVPEDRLQGGLEEMGPGVVGLRRPTGFVEHLQRDGIPFPDLPAFELADMGDEIFEGPVVSVTLKTDAAPPMITPVSPTWPPVSP